MPVLTLQQLKDLWKRAYKPTEQDFKDMFDSLIALSSGGGGTGIIKLGELIGADFDTTADQTITMVGGSYILQAVIVANTSVNLDSGGFELWTGANQTGTKINTTGDSDGLDMGLYGNELGTGYLVEGEVFSSNLIMSLGTPHGSPATADIRVYGFKID